MLTKEEKLEKKNKSRPKERLKKILIDNLLKLIILIFTFFCLALRIFVTFLPDSLRLELLVARMTSYRACRPRYAISHHLHLRERPGKQI
jgi:hypothetical protein